MSEAVEPIPVTIVSAKPVKTVGQKLAILTGVIGAVISVLSLMPVFLLTSSYSIQFYSLLEVPGGFLFFAAGCFIVAAAVGRYIYDHVAVRAIVIVLAICVVFGCIVEGQYLWDHADSFTAGTGSTFQFTWVLAVIGVFAGLAVVASSFTRQIFDSRRS